MITLLTLKRRAEEADKSFLPVDSPAVLLITLVSSLKTEILSMAFFFPPLTAAPPWGLFCRALRPAQSSPQPRCASDNRDAPLMPGARPSLGCHNRGGQKGWGQIHTLLPSRSITACLQTSINKIWSWGKSTGELRYALDFILTCNFKILGSWKDVRADFQLNIAVFL